MTNDHCSGSQHQNTKSCEDLLNSTQIATKSTSLNPHLPEPGVGVHPRDGVQGCEAVQQEQADDPADLHQAVHVPAVQEPRLHPLSGHLPQRHQAAEPPSRSR